MNVFGPAPAVERRPTGRQAERILAAELLDEFRAYAQTSTEFMARLGGRVVNDVLGVETCVFDAAATPVDRQWHVAAGCIVVANYSAANTLTVVAAGPAGNPAPASGVGVTRIPPGACRVVALASRTVTFYGTAADAFSYQAFTAAPQPVVG